MIELNLRMLDELARWERIRLQGAGGVDIAELERRYVLMKQELLDAWSSGNVARVFMSMNNTAHMSFLLDNRQAFFDRGLFEKALLEAYKQPEQAPSIFPSNT